MMRNSGFTLLELMVVLVILVLLAGLALPGYRDLVHKSRRSDARVSLSRVALLQERYYLNVNRYAGDFAELDASFASGNTIDSDAGHYALELHPTDDGAGWTVVASAVDDQKVDDACVRFLLDSHGTRTAFDGAGNTNLQCW